MSHMQISTVDTKCLEEVHREGLPLLLIHLHPSIVLLRESLYLGMEVSFSYQNWKEEEFGFIPQSNL